MSEHYPGEPPPVEMLRDLQRAIYGHEVPTPWPPAEEWQYLLRLVREARRRLGLALSCPTHTSEDQ